MAVSSINGQGLASLVPGTAAAASPHQAYQSPGPRTADTVGDAAPAAQSGPGPSEEPTRVAAAGNMTPPVPRQSGVRIRLDESSRQLVAQVTNELDEVIKQIPPEERLKIAAQCRRLYGLMFDRKV